MQDIMSGKLTHPSLPETVADNVPVGLGDDETHDRLLDYLLTRLGTIKGTRTARLQRYARIDKLVSAWQRLSVEDSKRDDKEARDGSPQAISAVVPVAHTHLEDLVAFFAGVFSPNSKDFFQLATPEASDQMQALVKKMNQDANQFTYYFELVKTLRALLKYNIGGFHVEFVTRQTTGSVDLSGNRISAIDMYNTFWDSAVREPKDVHKDAEWAAYAEVKSRFALVREAAERSWWRVSEILQEPEEGANRNDMAIPAVRRAKFYQNPPNHAGISIEDETKSSGTTFDLYFQGIDAGTEAEIHGHELITMYCRLNPADFDLRAKDQSNTEPQTLGEVYQLWRFKIIDSKEIVFAERVPGELDEIPMYLGHLNVDEMGEATKSIAELLKPFQRIISFMFNIYVAGARGNIWGFVGVNPKFYDTKNLQPGDVAGILTMKGEAAAANLSPSQGIARIQNNASETRTVVQDIASLMGLMQQLFPSQSLPSQIAGIDRAIESQVAAVMQGVSRRLHMAAHLMDDQILTPTRMAAYHNIGALASADVKTSLEGLGHSDVILALGTGLKQINREAAAMALQRILFALIQSPDTVQQNGIDILKIMEYWGQLFEIDLDIDSFKLPAENPEAGAQQPGAGQAEATSQPNLNTEIPL